MATLKDLGDFAGSVPGLVKDLFPKAAAGAAAGDSSPAINAVDKLAKLVNEATTPTAATNVQAAEVVTSMRGALLEVLKQAAASTTPLAATVVNTIGTLFSALEDRAGQLLEQAAFATIPTLISPESLQQIKTTVAQAEQEIKTRQQAKEVLDAVVKAAIVAAQIAVKVAAA